MPIPLPVADESLSPQSAWSQFVERRQALTEQMELAVCDGCDGCGLRCTDGFLVTEAEWQAVQAYLNAQPEEAVARVARQEKVADWPGAEESGATLTYCRYRDRQRNRCSIYPVRPTVCRLFGHTRWLPCPIEAVEKVPNGAEELWREYRCFERRTWNQWEEREALSQRERLA